MYVLVVVVYVHTYIVAYVFVVVVYVCIMYFRVSLFGCSPEGVICWWCDVLKNSACMPALHASLDVGEGSVYSVTRLPFKDCPGYLVASSLSNLWVVCVQKSQQTSEVHTYMCYVHTCATYIHVLRTYMCYVHTCATYVCRVVVT